LLVAVLLIGAAAFALWRTPSSDYVFVPDRIREVAPLVTVPNERQPGDPGTAGIYMVDIFVKRANLLERLFPFVDSDATLVPAKAFNPLGVSDQQKAKSDALVMSQSQQIASAVALRALGYTVKVTQNGAQIALVLPHSPAERAGLQPGDVIVEANGSHVSGPEELRGALAGVRPGTSVPIVLRRSAGRRTVTVATQASSDNPNRAVFGIEVEQATTISLPVRVKISAGDIGGPSAGLAFALDIVDELGADVDQGRTVVVTGALGLDGSVEPIGGIKQKAISARDAHADVFIVPVDNAPEARKYAGDVKIEAVSTFDEALKDLGVKTPAAAPA
jgi:PDZ domain-containing protein